MSGPNAVDFLSFFYIMGEIPKIDVQESGPGPLIRSDKIERC